MLQKAHRQKIPLFDDFREQVRSFELKLALEADWKRNAVGLRFAAGREEMGVGDAKRDLIALQVRHAEAEKRNDHVVRAVVDGAEGVKLVDARGVLAVFDVGHPSVRDVVLAVAALAGDVLALFLHVPGGQAEIFAQQLQALTGARTRLACVHRRESYACDSSMSSHLTVSSISRLSVDSGIISVLVAIPASRAVFSFRRATAPYKRNGACRCSRPKSCRSCCPRGA